MIRFEHVRKAYGNSRALDDVSFEIGQGEFAVFIGPSGCGKTTTLKIINRLMEPDGGRVWVDGKDISQVNGIALRRTIGYVIQQIGLFPNMTVAQNISVVPKLLKYDKRRCDEIVHEMMEMVNLSYDEYAHKYPSELSGGQQQRVGVLRALAASPPIVLMDEPFGALDPITRGVLQQEVRKLQRELGKTIVFVTHDMDEALEMADRIIFMDGGRIVQNDTPQRMLAHPASDLVASFLGKRISGNGQTVLTVANFMRTSVVSVQSDRSILECAELMARHNVDTLLVCHDDGTYLGTISIESIRRNPGRSLKDLISQEHPACRIDEGARESFDKLLSSEKSYAVVLHQDNTIAGIITKTGMARAMADALWGDE